MNAKVITFPGSDVYAFAPIVMFEGDAMAFTGHTRAARTTAEYDPGVPSFLVGRYRRLYASDRGGPSIDIGILGQRSERWFLVDGTCVDIDES